MWLHSTGRRLFCTTSPCDGAQTSIVWTQVALGALAITCTAHSTRGTRGPCHVSPARHRSPAGVELAGRRHLQQGLAASGTSSHMAAAPAVVYLGPASKLTSAHLLTGQHLVTSFWGCRRASSPALGSLQGLRGRRALAAGHECSHEPARQRGLHAPALGRHPRQRRSLHPAPAGGPLHLAHTWDLGTCPGSRAGP